MSSGGMIVYYKQEHMWEEVVVAHLRCHHSILLEVLRKTTETSVSVTDFRAEIRTQEF